MSKSKSGGAGQKTGGGLDHDTVLTAAGIGGDEELPPSLHHTVKMQDVFTSQVEGSNPKAAAMLKLASHVPTGKTGDLPGQSAAELLGRDWEPDD